MSAMRAGLWVFCIVPLHACGQAGSSDDDFVAIETGRNMRVSALASDDGDCATCGLDPTALAGDALGRQTPSTLSAGLLRVELLRSPVDESPHVLLASEQPIDTDLVAGATFVDVDVGSIPPGSYPFMRVTLANTTFTVDATAHVPFSGTHGGALFVDYALSDYDDDERGPRAQGDYLADFEAPEMRLPVSENHPVAWPAPYPGAVVDTSGGMYRVTFLSPEVIDVSHEMPQSVDVGVTFHIDDAFVWAERDGDGSELGVFDLSPSPLTGETPISLGITGFSLEVLAVDGEAVGGESAP